jgi:hypothetical protein
MEKTMFQDRSNKLRTQILDLVDDTSQLSVLSQADLRLVTGGRRGWALVGDACSCAAGGGADYDNYVFMFSE